MLFVNIWQLSKDIPPTKLAKAAAELMEKEKFPIEGTETLQWLVCPGGFGISVIKADSEADAFKVYTVWAEALPGYFEYYKTMPAVEAQDAIALALE